MTEQEAMQGRGRHGKKRLSDKILTAFHHACDQTDIEIAWELLNVLEFIAMRQAKPPAGVERRAQESLVAAHGRLWQIRHLESLG